MYVCNSHILLYRPNYIYFTCTQSQKFMIYWVQNSWLFPNSNIFQQNCCSIGHCLMFSKGAFCLPHSNFLISRSGHFSWTSNSKCRYNFKHYYCRYHFCKYIWYGPNLKKNIQDTDGGGGCQNPPLLYIKHTSKAR